MADQGASQRRGNDTATTSPIGQATTTSPQSSSGETYFDNNLGASVSNDLPSEGARFKDTQVTGIGLSSTTGTSEVTSSQGASYRENSLGAVTGNDIPSLAARSKETQIWPIGTPGSTSTSSAQGVYFQETLGQISPIVASGGGGGGGVTTYYKLRARDTGASYVEWVTTVTPLTTASYPGTPVGTLVDLTVLSVYAH